ncbi:hypothetical protein ROZALSC1DRAFT_27437 [Rozella allomycis CSF55]|uniref:Uncharacterized protein n=1 Tax=Rozella allomycis (strain CSF55) TaxID=988480 RepID=A0A075AQI9_ROZAC|nr:hypothetical protein O9G_001332 [Rozella allomycis CSF55]RKP21125.1 hypothetical protein ROZALSC1DRAFT_27437 [Rozella allomycis CSF55]|eukprot:EPZ32430.1 hypothetical protein O9G_001332 [Rozella allomycis CSF55]
MSLTTTLSAFEAAYSILTPTLASVLDFSAMYTSLNERNVPISGLVPSEPLKLIGDSMLCTHPSRCTIARQIGDLFGFFSTSILFEGVLKAN